MFLNLAKNPILKYDEVLYFYPVGTNVNMFTEKDLEQIMNQGISLEVIEEQLKHFRHGIEPITLISPATPGNGIRLLSEEDESRLITVFENALSSGLKATKFVPASGAASRMFKHLFDLLDKVSVGEATDKLADENPFLNTFFSEVEKFAFWEQLKQCLSDTGNKTEIIEKLLYDSGLGYGNKPKGQLVFHRYSDSVRTAFEEHLVEAASYCTGFRGYARAHFTVSPEHQEGFEKLLESVKNAYQKRLGVQFEVSFSHQHKSTDTIAVDPENNPFRNENGQLVFRPGGHGALLRNLNELDADIIFIKNIDNVVPDHLKAETKRSKKVLAGLLVTLRNKIFTYLEKLESNTQEPSQELIGSIENFLVKELNINFNREFNSDTEKILLFRKLLNRPLRICGMVKNEGEPGGGPFITACPDGTRSLQIIEKAQVNLDDVQQAEHFKNSTHFNPVDIVCSIKDFRGNKFDLNKFVDHSTCFISSKTYNGKKLKALELPGLWNGSMSDWNTIFVEVPAITFNPVKTINDLLRPEHQ